MKLTYTNERFEFHCTKEERATPKSSGFRFDWDNFVWYSTSLDAALQLADYADKAAADQLNGAIQQRNESLTGSQATDADIDIPAPTGLEYLPYQRAGIAYSLNRRFTYIADEMGLGKTIQAIGHINAMQHQTALVICPASLARNWQREASKWLVAQRSIEIANGKACPDSDVVIVSYQGVKKHLDALDARGFDCIIMDEAHFIKNPKAARTKTIFGSSFLKSAKTILALSGTPAPNRPIEVWPFAKAFDSQGLGKSWYQYVTRYCEGHETRFGWDVSGASNLPEFNEKLREVFMVRRLKDDVLTELPPKFRQVIQLPTTGASAAIRQETKLSKVLHGQDDIVAALDSLRQHDKVAFENISKARHDVALAKTKAAIEHIQNAVESGPVVVFAHHKDVISQISEAFEGSAVLTGDTPIDARQDAVDRFQNGDTDVFIGSMSAAGVGLTLTRSSTVIFVEMDWVPATMQQAEDRCHRIGQQDNVLVQYLVFDGTVDAQLAHTLAGKTETLSEALDGDVKLIDADIEATQHEDEVPTAAKPTADPVIENAVLEGCRILAGMCDGASSHDRKGFNKLDVPLGHSLATQQTLTAKQAAIGKKMLLKYHRQLPVSILESLNA